MKEPRASSMRKWAMDELRRRSCAGGRAMQGEDSWEELKHKYSLAMFGGCSRTSANYL